MIRSSQLHIMIITWSLRRVTNVRLAESVGDFVLQTQIAYQRKSKNGPKVHETLKVNVGKFEFNGGRPERRSIMEVCG